MVIQENKNNKEYFSSIYESHNGSSLGFFLFFSLSYYIFVKSIPGNGFDYILLACYLFEYKDELINKTWLVRKICIIFILNIKFIHMWYCFICRWVGWFEKREPVDGTENRQSLDCKLWMYVWWKGVCPSLFA